MALIKLKTPIEFHELTEKVCLPTTPRSDIEHLVERHLHVLGFGQTQEDKENDSYTLREVDLRVLYTDECNENHNITKIGTAFERILEDTFYDFPDTTLKSYQICSTSFNEESGTCSGDSGAPGLYKRRQSKPFTQYAVLHGSIGDSCDNKKFPSLFTRIDEPEIFNWIKETIQPFENCDHHCSKRPEECPQEGTYEVSMSL